MGVLSPGDKAAGREADYSLPSSADVKNGGDITPFPYTFIPWCLINRTETSLSFTFTIYTTIILAIKDK
jgi:hypothetical protein